MTHYQVIPYQGSLILDPIVSGVGYLLAGDGLLAWHVVALLHVAVMAAAGSRVLLRIGGIAPALAWPVVLACAPFLVKDGIVAAIGGHAGGFAWGLAALAVALEARRGFVWGLLAGLILAVGTWYVRSVVVVAPALLLACTAGGARAIGGLAVGAFVLPLLLWWNVNTLEASGLQYAQMGREQLWDVVAVPQGTNWGVKTVPERAIEASGLSFPGALFLQPPGGEGSSPGVRPAARLSGRVWVVAWVLAVPLGLLGLARRKEGRRELLAAVLLCAGWIGAYVASGLTIEAEVVEKSLATDLLTPAPRISSTRYIIPVLSAWIFGLPLALAAARSRPLRVLNDAALLACVLVGGLQTLGDWRTDHDGPALYRARVAHSYPSVSLAGRLPPIEVHLRSLGPDAQSRRYHLQSTGRLLARGSGPVLNEPRVEAEELRALQQNNPQVTDADLADLAFGMGMETGLETLVRDDVRVAGAFEAMLLSADAMGGAVGEAYLKGAEQTTDPYFFEGALRDSICELSGGRKPASICGAPEPPE